MPENPTFEELIAQAKVNLVEGLSISPIGEPPEGITGPARTYFDNAITAAGTALFKTHRQKQPDEKATAIIVSALTHHKVGFLTRAACEIAQAKELTSASFVKDLVTELTGQPAEIILG